MPCQSRRIPALDGLEPLLYSAEAGPARERAPRLASMTLQANNDTLITVFGGSGFLGRHLVRALAKRALPHPRRGAPAGPRRPPAAARPGRPDPCRAGQRAHPARSRRRCATPTSSINLVGILFERGRQRFDAVQAFGAEQVALAAANHGARMIHVSAIGADENSPSRYARAKAEGEQAVLAATPDATIFRPSIMFGPEDDFFNQFAAMARILPALPLIGGGETRFQPVFVGDVARGDRARGRRHGQGRRDLRARRAGGADLQGADGIRARRDRAPPLLVPLPFALAKLQATFLQYLPKPLLTPDQVELLKTDNVVSRRGRARRPHARRRSASRRRRWRRSCRPISGASARPGSSASRRRRCRTPSPLKHDPGSRPLHFRDRAHPSASAISPSAPTMTRHQANSAKPWRCT